MRQLRTKKSLRTKAVRPKKAVAAKRATPDPVEAAAGWLGTKLLETEDLRRYRETRDRLGRRPGYSLAEPNLPYVVHSS